MHLPIKRTIERLPGGMMIVPLFTGALITTVRPASDSTSARSPARLFSGALPILAVFYVCLGSTIELRSTPYILKKGGALFGAKVSRAGAGSRRRAASSANRRCRPAPSPGSRRWRLSPPSTTRTAGCTWR